MRDGLLNGATIVPFILLGAAWALYLAWPRPKIAADPRPTLGRQHRTRQTEPPPLRPVGGRRFMTLDEAIDAGYDRDHSVPCSVCGAATFHKSARCDRHLGGAA